MTVLSLRRAFLGLACASAALLAACGSSTTESALTPSRIIAFGDAFSVVTPGAKYTVNDSSINNWVTQFASSYGLSVAPNASGGQVYAQGNARIGTKPDAAGSSTTLTVTEQVDTFLAGNSLGANDVVLINGGISDLVVDMAAVTAGSLSESQMQANAAQYGKDLGAQVRRLVNAGGKHVVVVGPYNLGITPWATTLGKTDLLKQSSSKFNEAMLVSIVDLGSTVLYIDATYYFNLVSATPTGYGFVTESTLHDSYTPKIACTSVDSGAGIGTGSNQVNSSLCTTSTIASGVTYDQYLFADNLYFTPLGQRLFGLYAYDKVHLRW
ncbi:phospholipase/lecithinase/hemolysin [Rhodoferax ferrireducens]|uniref:Phospholipase/lecithinase/hemolysin n=1 Tax=Rhodoferax ferrireducens TaxID=192843 RepID=A0ABU2CB91_9BURK|nr:SGNH/GDSL hydrolase family protein [Rhodoferax ferrireducens]MDR7378497.1 phospholipase/lecithinase/hemolysin [Rhodoferax ferrireducens]